MAGCLAIEGNIFIHDSVDIVNLGVLSELERVDKGYILVLNNAALTEVSLPKLTDLQNGFAAIDNPELTSVLMPTLPVMNGDLTLRNNAKLNQLDFKAIQRIDNVYDAYRLVPGKS